MQTLAKETVQNGDNRKELYQALWLLIASPDPEKFHQHLQQILCTWKDKEPRFIEYFQSAYTNRVGHTARQTKITHYITVTSSLQRSGPFVTDTLTTVVLTQICLSKGKLYTV